MADEWVEAILYADLLDGIQHGVRVSNLTYLISEKLGLDDEECYDMAVAGMLHDIGKLKLSSYLYGRNSKGMLIEEMQYMRMHPQMGYAIVKDHGYSDRIAEAVLYHHENCDGSGYPFNLKKDNIPLGARIIKVADSFIALISERPYREAFSFEEAMEIMIEDIKEYDMQIFLSFMSIVNDDKLYNDLKSRQLIIDFDMYNII